MVRGRLRSFASVTVLSGVEWTMWVRVAVVCACVLGASSAIAEELAPDQARAFVVGKLFAYNCFDGTEGVGRIFSDGSVVGTVRAAGQARVHFAALPAGTIKVDGGAVCAHLPGLIFEPCFRVQKIDYRSFRGSLSGLSFAYCDFHQRNPRTRLSGAAEHPRATPVAASRPTLRPALEE